MLKNFAIVRRILFDALGHYNDDDGWAMSSHVALSTIMALFPFLIFAGTLAAFLGAEQFSETATHLIFDTWPKNIADPLVREVQNVLTVPRGGLLTISIIAAAYFAASGIEALRVALNRAYREKETRSLIFRRTQSLFFVLVAAVGMAAISILLVLAPLGVQIAAKWMPWLDNYTFTISFWRYLIAIVVLVIGLFAVHMWLPDGKRPFVLILPGIVITLVAWVISAMVFATYLARFANYFSTYAGLASIMVALVFLYILSSIFIVGAEINAAINIYAESRRKLVKR
jgi:membrane protein